MTGTQYPILNTQSSATWGLDRIDQRNLPLNGIYRYFRAGNSVNAYVIDSGIRPTHQQFGGRAFIRADFVGDGQNGNDCNGHGTHVAGTLGGSTYGVAKNVTINAVRVLGCSNSGATSGVIAGVDWVTNNKILPAVANMSLGGPVNTSLDNAVRNSIAAGITYVIAAGNNNVSASNQSPARVTEAITVAATDNADNRASFSNYGSLIDVFAPGVNITSAWFGSDTATFTISGTSMASPHVAGAVAQYLVVASSASPATVQQKIKNYATVGLVVNPGSGSPNRLLYNGNAIDDTVTYVRQLYVDFFGRQPGPGEADGWINYINVCGTDGNCLNQRRFIAADGFMDSDAFKASHPGFATGRGTAPYNQEYVTQCYLVFHRRGAVGGVGPGGEGNGWLNYLNSTGDYYGTIGGFVAGLEYRNRWGLF